MEFDINNLEPLLATLADLYANSGSTKQVAILAEAAAKVEIIDNQYSSHGPTEFHLYLTIPHYLFSQIADQRENLEQEMEQKISYVLTPYTRNFYIKWVSISPILSTDTQWRDKAKAFIGGQGITNQGRVHSDNIASKSCDGLLFRSQPEINLYKALKALGVPFAPLAVFIRGGQNYHRLEPDFLIIKNGITMVVEVDGDTVHRESAVEAENRLKTLTIEGAISQRVSASDCDTPEKAKECAANLMNYLKKYKENHR